MTGNEKDMLLHRIPVHLRVVSSRGLFGRRGSSKEERKEERQEIYEDIARGYYGDFHEFRKTGGKRFEAPNQLCSKREGVRFPQVAGRTLSGEGVEVAGAVRGCVSLVMVSLRAMGMRMCNSYRQPFVEEFGNNTQVKVFEISLVDWMFFRLFRRWIERNLRKEIPQSRHISFMVYTGTGVSEIVNSLQIGNTIVGYVHLLDKEGVVRWRAHATPTEREIQSMLKCTRQLLNSQNTNV